MKIFKRNKVKLSLIDDYINILLVENFFNNDIDIKNFKTTTQEKYEKLKTLTSTLKSNYDKVFESLKLNDLSLLILKKELKNNNSFFQNVKQNNFELLDRKLDKTLKFLTKIFTCFCEKIHFLKLNFNLNSANLTSY